MTQVHFVHRKQRLVHEMHFFMWGCVMIWSQRKEVSLWRKKKIGKLFHLIAVISGNVRNTDLNRLAAGLQIAVARQIQEQISSGVFQTDQLIAGHDHDIGQIAVGKCADMFFIDENRLELVGADYDVKSVLGTVGVRGAVDYTIVHGRVTVQDGRLVQVDEGKLAQEANEKCRAYLSM